MPSSDLRTRSLTLQQVTSVTAETTVRHVDQLDGETLDAFYDALEGDRSLRAAETDLEPGEVIVGTAYYRVETLE